VGRRLGADGLHRIDPSRSQAAAKELLGEDFGGFVVSDRYAGYHFLDVLQQQLCSCHVIRQLVEVSQRSGATGRRGKTLVTLARAVIAAHREFLTDGHDADWLTAQLQPLRAQIRVPLEQYAAGRHTRTANFAAGLLDEYRVADGALCRVVGRVDAEIGDVAERPQWAATPFVMNKRSCVFTYDRGGLPFAVGAEPAACCSLQRVRLGITGRWTVRRSSIRGGLRRG
jgi:hypothetical protein